MRKVFGIFFAFFIAICAGCSYDMKRSDLSEPNSKWEVMETGTIKSFYVYSHPDFSLMVSYIIVLDSDKLIVTPRLFEPEKIKAGQNGKLYKYYHESNKKYYYMWDEIK